jgi:DNA topoisomerase-3
MVQSGEMSLEEFVTKQAAWMSKQVTRCSSLSLTISGPPPAGKAAAPWKKKRKSSTRSKTTGTTKRAPKAAGK